MEFKHTRLGNGLTVVAEVNPAAASLAAGFFVRTGSRDETPEISGVSHFLEHMVFKGTDRRTAWDVNREFDEIGANYNASTSEETTLFYGGVLPEFQGRLVDLLADILRPALRREDFDVEKGVILEEIALYEDEPRFQVYDRLMTQFFAGHPLGNVILGTPESITALTPEQMRAYFRRRYVPGNITLAATGNLDSHALVDQVAEVCGGWEPARVERDTTAPPCASTDQVVRDERVTREHVGLMSPAPPARDDDRYAAQVLATILGDTTGSRLFYALVEPAVVDEAGASYNSMDGAGVLMTFLSTEPERAAEAIEITRREYRRFRESGPSQAELDAARNKLACGATLRGELPMGRLAAVGGDWLYRGEYRPLREHLKALAAVTVEDVTRVAREHDICRTSLLALGPLETL